MYMWSIGYAFNIRQKCVKKSIGFVKVIGQSAVAHYSSSVKNNDAIQRLNVENLVFAYVVGLFEGDGWFSIT